MCFVSALPYRPSNSRFLRVDLWATRTRRRNPPRRSATIFVTGTSTGRGIEVSPRFKREHGIDSHSESRYKRNDRTVWCFNMSVYLAVRVPVCELSGRAPTGNGTSTLVDPFSITITSRHTRACRSRYRLSRMSCLNSHHAHTHDPQRHILAQI